MCLIARTAGPNKILVISGVFHSKPKYQKGGRVWQIPCLHTVSKLRLNIMTLQIKSTDVNCLTGVPISVEGVAAVKLNGDTPESLELACQNFLDLKENAIRSILLETLEGHQRAIVSGLSVETIIKEREQFSTKVRETALSDLMKMGVHIVSYTICSISTSNGYLAALGKPATALVIRDARIGKAHAVKESDIAQAAANEEKDKKVFDSNTQITKAKNERDLVIQSNQKIINTAVAIARNATRLKKAELDQTLVNEQMAVELIEKKGEKRVMDERVKLAEKKLHSTVKLKAECDKYTMETMAEANRKKIILGSESKAFETQQIGEAEAEATRLKAEAEAKTMALKAKAYEQYGKAVLVGEVIKNLPKIAAEVAHPMTKMKKITLVCSGDGEIGIRKMVGEVISIMDEIPDGVNKITGIDLKGEISKVMNVR